MAHCQVNDLEYVNVIKLAPEKRYEYFVKKVCDWEEIWSLKDEKGWCQMGSPDGHECVPIWPAQRYAQALCINEWKDCSAVSISLEKWIQSWIPGMEKDRRCVAVFPTPEMQGIIRKPDELLADLKKELENYM